MIFHPQDTLFPLSISLSLPLRLCLFFCHPPSSAQVFFLRNEPPWTASQLKPDQDQATGRMFGGLRSAKAVVSEARSRLDPTAMAYGSAKEPIHNGHQPLGRTITSLKRWSVLNKELPGWHTQRT